MKNTRLHLAVRQTLGMVCVLLLLVFPAGVLLAQGPTPSAPPSPSAQPLSPDQLDALVAPVALYPDALLSEVLVAATYPLEVAEAPQWLQQNQNLKGQELMATFQMTFLGAPMIYYGDEAGMWGASDPDDRMPMPWPDLTMAQQATDPRGFTRTPDDANFDSSMVGYFRSIVAARRTSPSLCRGTMELIQADDANRTLVFSRSYNGETSLVFVNRSPQPHTVSFSAAGVLNASQGLRLTTASISDSIPSSLA